MKLSSVLFFVASGAGLGGCAWISGKDDAARQDMDGDGLVWPEDCDDTDADIGAAPTWYTDGDQDGYGDASRPTTGCGKPSGAVADDSDCDDTNGEISPGAQEIWYDGTDQDCSGGSDADADADGWDGVGGDDCDDGDASVHPDAVEGAYDGIDQDCDGQDADDLDADGYTGAAAGGDDCDDSDERINPGAAETWYDGFDQDCSGGSDGDADGDGHDATQVGGGDCEDSDAAINPDATESCDDGVDNDCDGAAICGVWGAEDLSGATATLQGESRNDLAGTSLATLTMSGAGAVLVGAPSLDIGGSGAGGAYVVEGSVTGAFDLSTSAVVLVGENIKDYAGESVASGADLDGDGNEDLVVGGSGYDGDEPDSGGAWLLYGPVAGSLDLSAADAILRGAHIGDGAGYATALGDLDGDGRAELVVGAWQQDDAGANAGAIYLLDAPSGATSLSAAAVLLTGAEAGGYAGAALAVVSDTDGDGLDELLVGAHGSGAGAAYLVLGGTLASASLADADATLQGDTAGDRAGFSVGGCDVDGDGYTDLLVGAPSADGVGAAYLVSAPARGALNLYNAPGKLSGLSAGDTAGYAVAGAGDLDGDGYEETVVGAPEFDGVGDASGAAWVVYGPWSGDGALGDLSVSRTGVAASNYAGAALAGGRDLDGDGAPDLLIGAYGVDDYHGAAYLLVGGGL